MKIGNLDISVLLESREINSSQRRAMIHFENWNSVRICQFTGLSYRLKVPQLSTYLDRRTGDVLFVDSQDLDVSTILFKYLEICAENHFHDLIVPWMTRGTGKEIRKGLLTFVKTSRFNRQSMTVKFLTKNKKQCRALEEELTTP